MPRSVVNTAPYLAAFAFCERWLELVARPAGNGSRTGSSVEKIPTHTSFRSAADHRDGFSERLCIRSRNSCRRFHRLLERRDREVQDLRGRMQGKERRIQLLRRM